MYRGRRFLSKDGKAVKTAIAWEITSQWRIAPIKGPVALNIMFYFSNKRMDIDNALKGLLDCMTGLVYEDDSQIEELHVFKMVDKKRPRVEIQVV
jgi:crossover junction endodeoxyribonuclease RusA